jgi:hypothetical protein
LFDRRGDRTFWGEDGRRFGICQGKVGIQVGIQVGIGEGINRDTGWNTGWNVGIGEG